MKDNVYKALVKQTMADLISFNLMQHFDFVYPLEGTPYVVKRHLELPPNFLTNYFQNSVLAGELYDSEFNAFWNTYVVEQ